MEFCGAGSVTDLVKGKELKVKEELKVKDQSLRSKVNEITYIIPYMLYLLRVDLWKFLKIFFYCHCWVKIFLNFLLLFCYKQQKEAV